MSEVTLQIQALEKHIQEQKHLAEMADIAVRLNDNPDFRKLILDGFCLNEAARYAQESGDPMLTKDQRQDALNMAQASGHLKRFLSVTILMGNAADTSIVDAQRQIEALRAEA